jgi:predicted DNA-binding antitoxin AbrB/MazE fold protein
MTVRAIYEHGLLRPVKPLPLKENAEVEIEIREEIRESEAEDPRSFVGFIKSGAHGAPIAQDHDEYLGK